MQREKMQYVNYNFVKFLSLVVAINIHHARGLISLVKILS